jgi:RNA polymerase sigma factor (sigma-70 family)
MKTGLPKVLEQLQEAGGGQTDGQLLARFVATRDEASFAALLRRHGPMVLGVCRRVLRNFHDAEDAFQATFLVLARKAPGVVKRDSVGSWLYAVAYHAAVESAHANVRRQARERQVKDMPHPEAAPGSGSAEAPDWRPLLDQELNRLSEGCRAAVVLCDLEGRSQRQAALLLGLPVSTLSTRLARARALLAKRLAGRGLALAGALAALVAADAAAAQVPAALVNSTARVAALVAAGQLAAGPTAAVVLMKGVMKAMLIKKLRLAVGAVMVAAAIGAVGFACRPGGQAQAQVESRAKEAEPSPLPAGKAPADVEALRREVEDLRATVRILLKENRTLEKELEEYKGRVSPGGRPGGDRYPGSGTKLPQQPDDRPSGTRRGSVPDVLDPSVQPRGPKTGPSPPRGPEDPKAGPPGKDTRADNASATGPLNEAGQSRREALAAGAQQLEAAMKALREARDPESEQRAAQLLERAARNLQEQFGPADPGPRKH